MKTDFSYLTSMCGTPHREHFYILGLEFGKQMAPPVAILFHICSDLKKKKKNANIKAGLKRINNIEDVVDTHLERGDRIPIFFSLKKEVCVDNNTQTDNYTPRLFWRF